MENVQNKWKNSRKFSLTLFYSKLLQKGEEVLNKSRFNTLIIQRKNI